jgi:DNA-binding CsgD family transcriptional regulator
LATEKAFLLLQNNNLPDILTKREIDFLRLCCQESLTIEKIGESLNLTKSSAYDYQKKLTEKLGLHSRMELAIFAIHTGIYPVEKDKKWY